MGTIVGRESECAALARLLDDAASAPAALVLEGPAGIGKSTLWNHALDLAAARGCHVLSCRPTELEARMSYAALGDLLNPVMETIWPQLVDAQRHAIEVALLRRGRVGEEPPEQHTVAAALLSAFFLLAREQPVLVAIDDAVWLDEPSARVLAFALRRVRDAPIGVLATVRTPAPAHTPLALDRAFAAERFQRVVIGPLSVAALHHVLVNEFETVPPRHVVVRVHDAAAGNPLLALELVRAVLDLPRSPAPNDPLPLRGELSDLIAARVTSLPDDARHTLLVAAAAAFPTVANVLAVTGAASWQDSGGAVAERARVIDLRDGAIAFTHPLLASAAYSTASSVDRRDVHRRLATIAKDPEVQARHLGRAALGPDAEIADALEQAADHAWERGAPVSAAELLERSVELTPPDLHDEWRRRAIASATYLIEAGDFDRAKHMLEDVVAEGFDGPLLALAKLRLARVYQDEGNPTRVLQLLFEASAAAASGSPDEDLLLELDHDIGWTAALMGNAPLAQAHGEAALARATERNDVSIQRSAATLLLSNAAFYGDGATDELLELALTQPAPTRRRLELVARVGVAVILMHLDRLDEGRAMLEEECAAAEAHGRESDLALALFNLGELECRAGNFAWAMECVDRAIDIAEITQRRVLRGLALLTRARVRAYTGAMDAARADAEEALAIGYEASYALCIAGASTVLGFVEWSMGDAAATHARLGPFSQLSRAMAFRDPGFLFWVTEEVEALVTLGERGAAGELLAWFAEIAEASGRPSALGRLERGQAVLCAAEGDLADAVDHAEAAVDHHERSPLPIELARSLLVRGQVLRRAKQKAAARASLEASRDLFARLGMPLWRDRAADELARISGRAKATDAGDLTETERRTAELAASGMRNRQIAAELFVSERTVVTNLSHAYAKLGISSRAELAAALSRR